MLPAQIGLAILAVGLALVGAQGLRGVPDSTGQKTSPGVALACIALGAGLLGFVFVVLPDLFK